MKDVKEIKEFINTQGLSHKGAVHDYKVEWEADRYLVGDKMFIMLGEDNIKRPIVTIKLPPEKGDFLRRTFAGDIVAGYYMNKLHWNSVYLDIPVDKELLKELIEDSYKLVFAGLTKKRQKEILEE